MIRILVRAMSRSIEERLRGQLLRRENRGHSDRPPVQPFSAKRLLVRSASILLLPPLFLFSTAKTLVAACTASEKNSYYSLVGSGTTASESATINAAGDLVTIAAWCYPSCTPAGVTLGSQAATQTAVSGLPGLGVSPDTGQGFIFYILSAAASGSQTLTFTATGAATQTQVAYIDFTPSAGCTFLHGVDSPVGSGTGGISNAPSITPQGGDLLFNFTWVTEHVTTVNSPWSCTIYVGGTGDCSFDTTRNADAYILSAPAGGTANNMTMIHATDSWQGLISSFTLASGSSGTPGKSFYIAANGSDSNSGTSNTSPWLHAPGMPNCTANCAAHTPAPGDQFIFRGGDTWHFGNGGASPYVGGTWNWQWSGTSGSPIYIGVDNTWYSGSTWSRPILNGDNPTSTSTTLSSCTYQVPGGNVFTNFSGKSYFTFDNFEFTGLCQSSTGSPFGQDIYVKDGSANHALFEHLYFHGWTHVQFNCGTQCFNAAIFQGGQGSGQQIGLQHQYIVVDGSDSDPAGAQTFYDGMYDVSYSVFTHAAQMIGSLCHLFHDNLVDNWYDPGDGHAHGNVYECVGEAAGTNAVYNNLIRHISPNGVAQVNFWPEPLVGTTDYYFGNVMYDVRTGGNYFNIGQNSGAQGTINIFNNTFEQPTNGSAVLYCNSSNTHPFAATNNHYILDGPSPYSSPCSGGTFTTELATTHSTATANGYTSAQSFAYSPTAGTNPTVKAGTNVASYCSALGAAGLNDAAAACQSDTRYACTYNVSDHTISCPARVTVARPSTAWDIGSYQFGSTQASRPNAPTNLLATVQ